MYPEPKNISLVKKDHWLVPQQETRHYEQFVNARAKPVPALTGNHLKDLCFWSVGAANESW